MLAVMETGRSTSRGQNQAYVAPRWSLTIRLYALKRDKTPNPPESSEASSEWSPVRCFFLFLLLFLCVFFEFAFVRICRSNLSAWSDRCGVRLSSSESTEFAGETTSASRRARQGVDTSAGVCAASLFVLQRRLEDFFVLEPFFGDGCGLRGGVRAPPVVTGAAFSVSVACGSSPRSSGLS